MSRAYLDHASSAPLRPAALAAMLPFLEGHPGDPGRLHEEGRTTRVAVENAREQVAALFGARPREVVFTATAAESVNTAIWGAVERAREQGGGGHVVTTAVEHSAVLEACGRAPVELSVVGVDGVGRFTADSVIDALRDDTTLVTIQLANHEVGTVQTAVPAIVAAARDRGVAVHVDASAASGHLPVGFGALGADLCSVDGHTWGAPKGAAALLVRRGLRFPPFVVGGAQERGGEPIEARVEGLQRPEGEGLLLAIEFQYAARPEGEEGDLVPGLGEGRGHEDGLALGAAAAEVVLDDENFHCSAGGGGKSQAIIQ